jgi:hypothetical protein
LEPIADPVITIGASNPAEPPKPTVTPLVIMWDYILLLSTFEEFLEIE